MIGDAAWKSPAGSTGTTSGPKEPSSSYSPAASPIIATIDPNLAVFRIEGRDIDLGKFGSWRTMKVSPGDPDG